MESMNMNLGGGGALNLKTSTLGEKEYIFHSLSWKKGHFEEKVGHFVLCETTPLPPDFYTLGAKQTINFYQMPEYIISPY